MVGGRGGGMGRRQERQALMVAFAVALLMGTAVYFRIWARQSSDPSFTADDREELRRQFEQANLEAMDESDTCTWLCYAPQTLHLQCSCENSLHRLRPR